MKTLFDFIREPIIIGAIVLAVLIVIGAYLGSHYYYGEVEIVNIPEPIALAPSPPPIQTSMELDFGGPPEQAESKQTEVQSDLTPSGEISIEDFLAELSEEEKQSLTLELADELPRESPHGLGPYPEIPPDYPRQNIWDDLEDLNENNPFGRSSIDHELMHRTLIKLWNQGKRVEGAVLDSDNGRIYPMYKDTVYINWSEDENEDGSVDRYIGRYRCHPSLKDYRDSVENGTQPSWLKVVAMADGGIDPYSFLDLP